MSSDFINVSGPLRPAGILCGCVKDRSEPDIIGALIPGFHSLDSTATFYVFPNVAPVCNELGITSHGLALYLLEGADDNFGGACLGGECFGEAGAGFAEHVCREIDGTCEIKR